jgi:hypothetical protein
MGVLDATKMQVVHVAHSTQEMLDLRLISSAGVASSEAMPTLRSGG